jgi:hypothetical protein
MARSRLALVAIVGFLGCTEASGPVPVVGVPPVPDPAPPPTSSVAIGPPTPPAPPPPPPVEGAPAPPKQTPDWKYQVDGSGLLLGVTSTELWVLLGSHYTVVIDRATGCVTEGYAQPKSFDKLHESGGMFIEEAMKKPETLQGIRDMVGVGRRVGALGNPFTLNTVWSPDGTFIAFAAEGHLFQSRDGGQSFDRVDRTPRHRLLMSKDGKFLTYEENHEYYSVPVDGSRPPQRFTTSRFVHNVEMRPNAEAFFTRAEKTEMCADLFDLASAKRTSSTCLPIPAVATGVQSSREWEAISPNGKYGIVKWEEGRKNMVGAMAMTYVLDLVEMATKKTVKTVLDMHGEVDDSGNMVMQSQAEGSGDHTYYYPVSGERRLLGHHYLMAWHDKTAIMGVFRKGTLASRKCDLVKMVKTP